MCTTSHSLPHTRKLNLYFGDDWTESQNTNSVYTDIVGMVIYIMASSDPHLPIPVLVAIATPPPSPLNNPIAESITFAS